jgi:UDP-glucose 4-epimerase
MTVVLLGGAGFIGLAVAEALAKAGARPLVADGARRLARAAPRLAATGAGGAATRIVEPGDRPALAAALAGAEAVIHLSWTSVPASSMAAIAEDARDNVVAGIEALQAAVEAGVGRFVFVSSGGAVYGRAARLPAREDDPTEPISAYGVGKLAMEKYVQLFSGTYGLPGVTLRLSNPFGPYQLAGTPVGVVARMVQRVARGEPIEIFGDGSTVRDYLEIGDAASALALAADPARLPPGLYNVGSGEGMSLLEVAATVGAVSGRTPELVHRPARGFDVPAIVLDTERLRTASGWRPEVSFAEGVARIWRAAAG